MPNSATDQGEPKVHWLKLQISQLSTLLDALSLSSLKVPVSAPKPKESAVSACQIAAARGSFLGDVLLLVDMI